MKKRLLTAALVALLPLSLAACGGQSKQAACQIINDKAVKAIDGLDPSNTEDMIQGMTQVATVLKSDDITNKDVKAAAVAAGDSAQALADFATAAAFTSVLVMSSDFRTVATLVMP